MRADGCGPDGRRPAIRAVGLRKRYGTLDALDGFDLEAEAGAVHGLLGPNGAGKSTAVSILSTLVEADGGTAEVAGADVRRDPGAVRRRAGLIGQHPAVDEILGGRQNLVMFGRLLGLRRREAAARADELLEAFGLAEAAARPASSYSGGMRRRLDIAAGMILDPEVLFLDEPTAGLDPRGRIDVWEAVARIAARGTTVLLTTQHLEEADRLAHRVSIMKAGRIIAEGAPDQLKRQRGGDRIEIAAGDPAAAADIGRALTGATGPAPEVDGLTHRVTVPAPRGTADLSEAVRRLDAAGLAPDDIGLRRPTLDEVFLALTEKEDA
ncbi:ATP-binding cassette domain-containing protein [Brevibacterium album]|uniref:ATP-binding cassette domain-containing protein n=1 Tax=Brevibacterium album TaxID=417948 RepID=UPI001FDF7D93|nr:ATP-binding cassette domain-containing protein [Brevibacterium album]